MGAHRNFPFVTLLDLVNCALYTSQNKVTMTYKLLFSQTITLVYLSYNLSRELLVSLT